MILSNINNKNIVRVVIENSQFSAEIKRIWEIALKCGESSFLYLAVSTDQFKLYVYRQKNLQTFSV